MKLGIMQPYFLPYIGYFQLVNAVDQFVIYDDVNYIKQGWINRNRILLDEQPFLFTLATKGASSFKKINEINVGTNKDKLLKTFQQVYSKAPYYSDSIKIISEILEYEEINLARFVGESIKKICDYLEIKTTFLISSELEKNKKLTAENRVLDICKNLKATVYINPIGGFELYSKDHFFKNGIELKYLKAIFTRYRQFGNNFLECLSIVDVMMFNSPQEIRNMLNNYKLI